MFFRLCLLLVFYQTIFSQTLGPSLWDWGFVNTTSYTIYPDIPYTNPILIPHAEYEAPSACNSGPKDPWDVGFACPHLLLFSSDLLLAANRDGLAGGFFYGTAATQSDNDCGKCFQVKVLDPETGSNITSHKQLLLQITNSGVDVVPGQFDVHMAAGGFGYYTACNKDCRQRFCQGGPCAVNFYESSFDVWTPTSNCYGGGLKLLSDDYDKIWEECGKLIKTNDYKDSVLWQTCWYANIMFYHQNFFSTDTIQVRCPDGLTKTTGLKRKDEEGLPYPDINNKPNIFCRNRNCITAYHDCCKMSCSWKYKGNPDTLLSRVYTCDHDGFIIV
jgi:hypothetical protein